MPNIKNMPKFNSQLQNELGNKKLTESNARHGVILEYDRHTNTATVALSSPDSEELGDIHKGVLCPVYMGIQMAAPEPGRSCWVVFKSISGDRFPMITHYFNHNFNKFDRKKQNNTIPTTPRFYLDM